MTEGIDRASLFAVQENKNRMKNDLRELAFGAGKLFIVENYLEAVGVMTALKAGVAVSSVRRPLEKTKVVCEEVKGFAPRGEGISWRGAVRDQGPVVGDQGGNL